MNKAIISLLVAVGLIGSSSQSKADTFGSGDNQFTLDFTMIGNAGQAADQTTGFGYVPYSFAMGTYAISQNQLAAAATASGQDFGGGQWSGNQPAAFVSWYQAAAFVNWLGTSTGHQAAYNLTYSEGAYTMALWQSGQAGYDPSNPYRNNLARYVLPSKDEFYKSAYGLSNGSGYTLYATASNTAPTAVARGTTAGTAVFDGAGAQPASVYEAGGRSSYGTMGQSGNVYQWEESAHSGANTDPAGRRGARGGYWFAPDYVLESSSRTAAGPGDVGVALGFRVAEITSNAVPEPSTYALFGIGTIGLLMVMRRKKTA